jgi:hypothetical protein
VTKWHDLRTYVFNRDKACIAFLFDRTHECRDKWGRPHSPYTAVAGHLLTLDHVWRHAGGTKGKRAPDHQAFLVPMCGRLNGGGGNPSRELRQFEREHLAKVEPVIPPEYR